MTQLLLWDVLFVTLVGAMAEWERTTIQERTAMGRRASARKG